MPASASCSSPEEIVRGLSSTDGSTKLKSLRDIKNQIIGNKTKKLNYIKLGAVPQVVSILASDADVRLLVQSAATVGSFACGIEAGIKEVLNNNCIPHLLRMLSNDDAKVVEAGARSLKMIFQSSLAPRGELFHGHVMEHILRLLASTNDNVAEVAASVIARCCESRTHQDAVAKAGALPSVLQLLASPSTRKKEAALDVLAALTYDNEAQSRALLTAPGQPLNTIVSLLKDKLPRVRLLACCIIANVSRACPEYGVDGGPHSIWISPTEAGAFPRDVAATVLSSLVKLLDEGAQIGEEAPAVLAHFVSDSESLQKAGCDADAIVKLGRLLLERREELTARHQESVLLALAALCGSREVARKQLVDLKVLPAVVKSFEHESADVRAAACMCTRSLSRSVKNLRTSLAVAQIEAPLLNLLRDPSPKVQAMATAAMCNIVLEFYPMRTVILNNGGIQHLVELARSMDPVLRLNSLWALKNLLFEATPLVKRQVMEAVTYSTLLDFLQDPEGDVQNHALQLIRNLVYGKERDNASDIAAVLEYENGAVLRAVDQQLTRVQQPDLQLQALYVMSNVATGEEVHKEAVMASSLPAMVVGFLRDQSNAELRLAAVWAIVNLTYPDGPGVQRRVEQLRGMGVEAQLQAMSDDSCIEVKDRVKTALEQFARVPSNQMVPEQQPEQQQQELALPPPPPPPDQRLEV